MYIAKIYDGCTSRLTDILAIRFCQPDRVGTLDNIEGLECLPVPILTISGTPKTTII